MGEGGTFGLGGCRCCLIMMAKSSDDVFFIAKKVWKADRHALILAALALSRWPIDRLVHHNDLSILPGDLGDVPLVGFDLWDYPRAKLTIEVVRVPGR